jgi:hypothetical protein
VAMPSVNSIKPEQSRRESVEQIAANRRGALHFLETARFKSAIRCDHLSGHKYPLLLTPSGEQQLPFLKLKGIQSLVACSQAIPSDIENADPPLRYRHMFPLSWVANHDDPVLKNATADLVTFLTAIMRDLDRGISSIDAKTFANVLFYELVDNVKTHSGASHCLIAGICRSPIDRIVPATFPPEERRFLINWAAQNRFPLVDVILGDTGIGIPASLADSYESHDVEKDSIPNLAESREQRILFWSLGRWTSKRDLSAERGTRGLFRVHQIVKGYRGLLTMRSGNSCVGWDHGGLNRNVPICVTLPSRSPGTFISIRLTSLPKIFQSLPQTSVAMPNEEILVGPMISLNGSGNNELPNEDVVRRMLSAAKSTTHRCVVSALEAPLTEPQERKRKIEDSLLRLTKLPPPGALVVVVLGMSEGEIEVATRSVNERLRNTGLLRGLTSDSTLHNLSNPVLALSNTGTPHWIGVTEGQEKLLSQCISATPHEGIEITEGVGNDVQTWIHQHDEWLYFVNPRAISARFGLRNIMVALDTAVCSFIKSVLCRSDCRGVFRDGPYLTPFLERAEQWLEPDLFFEDLLDLGIRSNKEEFTDSVVQGAPTVDGNIRSRRFAVAIMSVLSRTLFAKNLFPEIIVSDAAASKVRVDSLAQMLGLSEKPLFVGHEPDGPEIWHPVTDRRIVIYCDCLLGIESIDRIATIIQRHAGRPIAVCCLIDGRLHPEALFIIPHLGLRLPVTSVIAYSLEANESTSEDKHVAIDPISNTPSTKNAPRPDLQYPIPFHRIRPWTVRTGAIRFNHILRPHGRHFTFYIDAGRLLGELECRTIFSNELATAVREELLLNSRKIDLSKLTILFPTAGKEAQAELLASGLQTEFGTERPPIGVRRDSFLGRWHFPATLDVRNSHVVVVDWGAMSGHTVLQVLELAIRAGAKSVTGVICISQIREDEEQVIRSLSSMQPLPSKEPELIRDNNEKRTAPRRVGVSFLSSIKIRAYSRLDCPVCEQRTRLKKEREKCAISAVRDFIDKESRRIAPEDNHSLRDFVDVFGAHLSGEQTVRMAEFRADLEAAVRWTESRQQVVTSIQNAIRALGDTPNPDLLPAKSILCLLATELKWLRSPPLNFLSTRDRLAELCCRIVTVLNLESAHYRHAIIVLRSSSKHRFVQEIGDLIRLFQSAPLILEQILYCVFTLIDRAHNHRTSLLSPLIEGLRNGLLTLSPWLSSHEGTYLPLIEAAGRLKDLSDAFLHLTGTRDLDPMAAWFRLRDVVQTFQREYHRDIYANAVFLLPLISNRIGSALALKAQLLREDWDDLLEEWSICRAFLTEQIFPLLKKAWPFFDGLYGRTSFKPDFERLTDLVLHPEKGVIFRIGEIVALIQNDPGDPRSLALWQEFLVVRDWYMEVLLFPETERINAPRNYRQARLFSFLEGCPCSLDDALATVCNRAESWQTASTITIEKFTNDSVFCHRRLLEEVIEEIFVNALKEEHRDTNLKERIKIHVSIKHDEDMTILSVMNTGTIRIDGPAGRKNEKQGLASLAEKLQPYGAILKRPDSTAEFTFCVSVHLQSGVRQ